MESHRLILSVIVLGVIITVLVTNKPTITGFVPTTTYLQELDINVDSSQRFILNTTTNLSSLAMSGSISGPGLVSIYLSDGNHEFLVYSNKKKHTPSIEHITGLAVSEMVIEPGEKLDRIDSLPDEYTTEPGAFNNQCLDTCMISPDQFATKTLYLDAVIDPGTHLHISQLLFSATE
jgi:hypothetical protein